MKTKSTSLCWKQTRYLMLRGTAVEPNSYEYGLSTYPFMHVESHHAKTNQYRASCQTGGLFSLTASFCDGLGTLVHMASWVTCAFVKASFMLNDFGAMLLFLEERSCCTCITTAWLYSKKRVWLSNLPAYIPDMSLIASVWSIMQHKKDTRTTSLELLCHTKEIWAWWGEHNKLIEWSIIKTTTPIFVI